MSPALELGLGAQEVLSVPGTGRVVGVYSKAAYLRLPGGLVALTSFDVPPGPIHARTSVQFKGLELGEKVVVTASVLQAGPLTLHLGGAEVWRGRLPSAEQLNLVRGAAIDLLAAAPPSALETAALEAAGHLVAEGDLHSAGSLLGGRGPGLTPAGDDCLAGILLVAYIGRHNRPAGELGQLAAGVETNDISRTFLHWAARGQCIEPVHRFLVAAGRKHYAEAARALDGLTRFGHSSGSDLAAGLELGLKHLNLDRACSPAGAGG